MRRHGAIAAVLCAACGSSDPPPSKQSAPPPVVAVADAAVPDAAPRSCFAIALDAERRSTPFDADGERAGLRRIAHHARHTSSRAAPVRGVVKLTPGIATLTGLSGNQKRGLVVPDIGIDGAITMPDHKTGSLQILPPAFLEGAAVELSASKRVLFAIGDAGLETLARYQKSYVKPRLAKSPQNGGRKIIGILPRALIEDDIDGDGELELVAVSRIDTGQTYNDPDDYELGVLWKNGDTAFVRLCCGGYWRPPSIYLAPPTLTGGKPMLFTIDGHRISIDGHALTDLPMVSPNGNSGRAFDDMTPRPDAKPLCLQTSMTEAAQLVIDPTPPPAPAPQPVGPPPVTP